MIRMSPRILAALAIGLTLVLGSLSLSPKESGVENAATVVLQKGFGNREFIPVTDSDQNNIPDWQEVFAHGSVNLDEDFNPETQTGRFVVNLAQTISSKSAGTTNNDQLINNELTSANKLGSDILFTANDLRTTNDNSDYALKIYGNKIAEIAFSNPVPKNVPSPGAIFTTAVTTKNETGLADLDLYLDSYRGMISAMKVTPVPTSLVTEHLAVLNTYQSIYSDILAFQNVYQDSLPTMVRLGRYKNDVNDLYTAISNLYLKLHEAGIKWNESDTASRLIEVETR